MPALSNLSKINLLPKDSFEFSTVGKFLRWSLSIGRALVVLTEFVVILAFASRFWFDKKLNDLSESIDQKQTMVQSFVEVEREIRSVLERQDPVKQFLGNNLNIRIVVDELKATLPSGTVLSLVSKSEGQLVIAGTTNSELALAQTINATKQLTGIKKVSVNEISFDQKKGAVSFKITSTF